jgi:hypothetical protein
MQTVTVEPIKNALTGRDFVCKRSARSSSPKCDIRCDIQGTGPSPEHCNIHGTVHPICIFWTENNCLRANYLHIGL